MKLGDISDLNKDDILGALGLTTRPTISQRMVSSIGLFGLGALVGAGVALLLAPSSGEDLREGLGNRIRRVVPEANGLGTDSADSRKRDHEARSST
jgi:gas vesicle protein